MSAPGSSSSRASSPAQGSISLEPPSATTRRRTRSGTPEDEHAVSPKESLNVLASFPSDGSASLPRHLPLLELEDEPIGEDDVCPICQLLLFEPVQTRCGHTLCRACLARWADASASAQIQHVPLGPGGPDFEDGEEPPMDAMETQCPMCRTLTTAALDATHAAALAARYPRAYPLRAQDGTWPGATQDAESVTICIGNTHARVQPAAGSANMHAWTFFVRVSKPQLVEAVHVVLHPTFRPRHVILTEPPFEVARSGWGFFVLAAGVVLRPGCAWASAEVQPVVDGGVPRALPLKWTLDFDGAGSMGRLRLRVEKGGWEALAGGGDFNGVDSRESTGI